MYSEEPNSEHQACIVDILSTNPSPCPEFWLLLWSFALAVLTESLWVRLSGKMSVSNTLIVSTRMARWCLQHLRAVLTALLSCHQSPVPSNGLYSILRLDIETKSWTHFQPLATFSSWATSHMMNPSSPRPKSVTKVTSSPYLRAVHRHISQSPAIKCETTWP